MEACLIATCLLLAVGTAVVLVLVLRPAAALALALRWPTDDSKRSDFTVLGLAPAARVGLRVMSFHSTTHTPLKRPVKRPDGPVATVAPVYVCGPSCGPNSRPPTGG